MGGAKWGGSEFLWHSFAEYCISVNYHCIISISEITMQSRQMVELKRAGHATLNMRKSLHSYVCKGIFFISKRLYKDYFIGAQRIAALLFFLDPYRRIFSSESEYIILSQGRTYDVFEDPFLMYWTLKKTKKTICICHWNTDYSRPHFFSFSTYQRIFQSFDKIFFVSKENWKATERQLAHRFTNAFLAKNPINRPSDNYIEFPDFGDNYYVGCVALLNSYNKGQDILLEVLSSNKWKKRNLKILMFGEGDDAGYYQELINLYELDEKVRLMGHQDVDYIWAQCQLLVQPSISEGLPLSLIEGMISGRAAVVTHIAGMPEIVSEGVNGFIAEAPKACFLDAALERAWKSREAWKSMGLSARETALAYYEKEPGKRLFEMIHVSNTKF